MTSVLKRQSSNSSKDDEESDDEIECPLSDADALAACKQFASVSSTNTGLAMMMLQQNGWSLQQAIDAYQNSTQPKSKPARKVMKPDDEETTASSTVNGAEMKGSKHLKVMSWNIDGLDEQEKTLEIRTRGVVNVIKREEPAAVFLQEVVPVSLDLIRHLLPEYEVHPGNTHGYFVVILTRRELFQVENHEIVAYPGTKMDRNLLIVHAKYKDGVEMDLMTSHHESGTEELASEQRVEQLKLCFQQMKNAPGHRVVLFGGDLNLREKELKKAGDVPVGIVDLWIETGRRKEAAYTWDMNRNTNLYYPSNTYRPRARFDRLYFRASQGQEVQMKAVYFELEGLEKLSSIRRFCSDHWAIQAYFDL